MKLKPITVTAAVLAAALGFAATAMAAEQLPQVVVEAGPAHTTVVGRDQFTNAPIELVTVDYHVKYSDLDLQKRADVVKFHTRIDTAARAACTQLDELYPNEKPQVSTCTEQAVQNATPQVQAAIAAARDRGSHTH